MIKFVKGIKYAPNVSNKEINRLFYLPIETLGASQEMSSTLHLMQLKNQ
jgi:hypothetical protein